MSSDLTEASGGIRTPVEETADASSGWADIGSPTRLMGILARNNIRPAWLTGPSPLRGRFGYRCQARRHNTGEIPAPVALTERLSAMTAHSEASRVLDESFRAALLLTGSDEVAEYAVLDGIAALECGCLVDDALLVETVKSAIHRRADLQCQSETALSQLPRELQRLFMLAPSSRDCFVLRILLGITAGSCSRILRLGADEFGEALCAALQELPRFETHRATRHEIQM